MKSRLTFLILSLFVGASANAELGGRPLNEPGRIAPAPAKKSKRLSSKAMLQAVTTGYTVYETTEGLTTIDEYVNDQGIVFAVTWKGAKQVNPEKILGGYYNEYARAKAEKIPRGQKQVDLKTDRMHVGFYGHARDFRGHACDPDLAPDGVKCEDLE